MRVGLDSGKGIEEHAARVAEPRLVRAAQEFEAQMMKELLKPMTGLDALTGEATETGGDAGASGALGEFASEALGQAISRRGGFGIADRILHDLSHSEQQSASGKFNPAKNEKSAIRASE